MPWLSQAHRRWGHSPAGVKALGKAKIAEYDAATEGKRLPEKAKKRGKKRGKG